VLGLPQTYTIIPEVLNKAYARSNALHTLEVDLVGEQSSDHSAKINEAARVLRDPHLRAEYWLKLCSPLGVIEESDRMTTTASSERWGVTTTERWAQPISSRHAPGLSPRNWETEKSLWCELDSGRFNAREGELDTMQFFQSVQPLAVRVQDHDSKWLTVWGFPQQAMTSVRQYLESNLKCNMHVRIEEGNWMHIRLPTPEAYHQCLAMNGDVLFGKVMIGVQVCRTAHILDGTDTDKPLRMKQPTSRQLHPSYRWLRSLLDFLFDL